MFSVSERSVGKTEVFGATLKNPLFTPVCQESQTWEHAGCG